MMNFRVPNQSIVHNYFCNFVKLFDWNICSIGQKITSSKVKFLSIFFISEVIIEAGNDSHESSRKIFTLSKVNTDSSNMRFFKIYILEGFGTLLYLE